MTDDESEYLRGVLAGIELARQTARLSGDGTSIDWSELEAAVRALEGFAHADVDA
jgi:hypothetical protein